MTASRALSGKAPVSEVKRKAVVEAASKLGYRVNPILRGVMSEMRRGNARQFIGALAFLNTSNQETAWHIHPYNRSYLEGARERAESVGYALNEIWIGQPGWSPARSLKVLQSRGIQGFLIAPGGGPEQIDFDFSEFAVAAFGGLSFELKIHQVLPNYFHNYATCYDQLWALGYRRIGLFVPDYDLKGSDQQIAGGFLAAQWRNSPQNHIPIGHKAENWQSAEAAFITWFQRNKPDAIIANFDQVPKWLKEMGVSIPQDVGLAHPSLSHNTEGWSGVEIRSRLLGAQAIDLLTAQILRNERGLPSEPKRLVIPGQWVEGNTTGVAM